MQSMTETTCIACMERAGYISAKKEERRKSEIDTESKK